MKSFFKKAICVIFAVLMLLPANISAMASDEYAPETVETQNDDMARISGLIATYYIGVSGSGSTLAIVAKMTCRTDVVKCGFKDITIQKRKNSTASWENYFSYKELYVDDSSYTYTKTPTVPTGSQYRAICTFYAKKNIFSTQSFEVTSNTVAL